MRNSRAAGFIVSFLVVTTFASTAFAQKIRTYGEQAEQTYGTSTNTNAVDMASGQTGASTVTTVNTQAQPQAQGQDQQPAGAEGAEGETTIQPSYVTVFQPGGAQGALPINLTPDKMYSGIIPGTRDEMTQFSEARERGSDSSNPNRILWVGFDPRDDVTRVFFQTARDADYEVGEADGAVTVTFSNTRVAAYNFRRFIDTSFFNRNVERIDIEKVGKNSVRAKIKLRQFERPDVDRSGNYLYLDFSNGTSQAATSEE